MRRTFCILALLSALVSAAEARAQIDPAPSPVVAYEGRLSESNTLSDGVRSFVFSILDSNGVQLWNSGAQSITVTGGLYGIVLGSPGMPPLPTSLQGRANLSLRMSVDGVLLSPDVPLMPSLQAITAWNVNGPFLGDISGTQHLMSVDKLKGTPIDLSIPPVAGQVLTYSGSSWTASNSALGTEGPAGPAGPSGEVGPIGPAGPKGSTGDTGSVGPSGLVGPVGPLGPIGPRGTPGIGGPAGIQGLTGPPGPIGLRGLTGATGPIGAAGAKGATGNTGPTGPSGPRGAIGSVGPTGPAGAKGPTGATGAKGSTGASGPAGPIGPQGAIGAKGPAGLIGPQGLAGAVGPIGPAGAKGLAGASGPAGPIGPQGLVGTAGAVGPAGAQGIAGINGATGPAGLPGSLGPTGLTGPIGPPGLVGATGAVGPAGPQGIAGINGATGPAGLPGSLGPMGPAGPIGPQGLVGTAGAIGPAGAQGIAGINGAPGPAGLPGSLGPMGPAGPIGPQGLAGATGAVGHAGSPGINGTNGTNGVPGPAGLPGLPGPTGPAGPQGIPGSGGSPGINVKDYGAKGNGAADDTAAIVAAFNAASEGAVVYFPCGMYLVKPSTPFTPHSGTTILGASMHCSIIKYSGTAQNQTLFSLVYNSSSNYGSQIRFQDIMIEGGNIPGTDCVYAGSSGNPKTQHITFRDVKITQCDPGIKTGDVWFLVVDNSLLEWNYGSAFEFDEDNAVTGAFFENGTRIGNNGGHGIVHDGKGTVTQLVVRDSEVSYNGKTEIVTGNARDVVIDSVWLEEDTTPRDGIDVTGCIACTVADVHSYRACRGVVSSTPTQDLRVERNSFTVSLKSPIVLPTGSKGEVSNNRFDGPLALPATMTNSLNDFPALTTLNTMAITACQ